jgi:hypothetical protein
MEIMIQRTRATNCTLSTKLTHQPAGPFDVDCLVFDKKKRGK